MSRLLIVAASALVSSSALAQEPDFARAPRVTVTLSSFNFAPAAIHLRAGQPVVLHLVNEARGGHNFSAPEFFAAATVSEQDKGLIYMGAIELRGGQSKDIALVPRRGAYKLRCTHTMHTMFGMKGDIVVD
ncbi:cupredoxin domain-containing protein [Novosphingobium sp. G106]|uniref:cupredoxin domain-containing protein n=1 Tax=Novosphingobium sp. G106 TaxID=2849500 RepID=UPI001C2CEAC5|nr:cupredoxin domain-containing protein [Novosphingobium sp. G106]MBV1687974.1 cupredoxin domain-containing protein [Novosphingobium sp. G106]